LKRFIARRRVALLVPVVLALAAFAAGGVTVGPRVMDGMRVASIGAGAGGGGLTGTYYQHIDFTGASVTRVDPQIDFSWGMGSPAQGIDPAAYSVRWTGSLTAPQTGVYRISVRSRDGVRVQVGNQLVVNSWTVHPLMENSGSIALTGGTRYPIQVDYYQQQNGGRVSLQWSGPGAQGVIPSTALTPAGGTPAPAPSPSGQPTPTAQPTSPTPAPGTGSCALPNYPKPNCTGVPAGTVYTHTVNGEYNVTTPGTVIDRWHITGQLNIQADNVTISNSKIEGGVFNQFGGSHGIPIYAHPYTINDSTLGPDNGCSRIAGLQSGNYTATRVYIHNVDHGIDMSEPGHVILRDSFVTLCWLDASVTPPDGSHVDGIQTYCPDSACTGAELTHNTMDDGPAGHGTFTINMNDPHLAGPVALNDNLLTGASNYVIVLEWRTGPDFTVHNNRVVSNTWSTAAPASAEGTCAHQDWQGNSIVTIDSNWAITRTVQPLPCIN
jgi:PA14 domain